MVVEVGPSSNISSRCITISASKILVHMTCQNLSSVESSTDLNVRNLFPTETTTVLHPVLLTLRACISEHLVLEIWLILKSLWPWTFNVYRVPSSVTVVALVGFRLTRINHLPPLVSELLHFSTTPFPLKLQLAANGYQTVQRNKASHRWNLKATRSETQLAAKGATKPLDKENKALAGGVLRQLADYKLIEQDFSLLELEMGRNGVFRNVALQGGRCMRVFGYKEVTMRCLEALELKGGDGGACKMLGWLLGDVMVMQGMCLRCENYMMKIAGCYSTTEVESFKKSGRDLNEPPNYKAALADPESDKWLEAMNTEMQSMKDN
ncbi:hypothetical protein Tco_0481480 [Tanacetum coccineum]